MLWSSSPTTVRLARRRPGQQLDQLELGVVRVLELVDQDVPIALPLRLEDRRVLPQQPEREPDLVAEVDPIGAPHQLARRRRSTPPARPAGRPSRPAPRRPGPRRRRPASRSAQRPVFRRRHVLVPRPADEGHQRVQEAGRVAERAVSVQRQLEEVLAQEDHLLRPDEHGRAVARGRPRRRGRAAAGRPRRGRC